MQQQQYASHPLHNASSSSLSTFSTSSTSSTSLSSRHHSNDKYDDCLAYNPYGNGTLHAGGHVHNPSVKYVAHNINRQQHKQQQKYVASQPLYVPQASVPSSNQFHQPQLYHEQPVSYPSLCNVPTSFQQGQGQDQHGEEQKPYRSDLYSMKVGWPECNRPCSLD